jgi:two-component system, LytTR family, sensor kinase
VEYQQQNKLTQVKYSQLQTQLAQSQLNALKSQLHPHFLFNTLNTISTLILKGDDKEAERMLTLLNNFLKTTVFESERQEILLEEELQFNKDYLEIEKVRFSDRLEVKEEIENSTLHMYVPTFLLQPIIENAIYHAVASKISKGIIIIKTRRLNDSLILVIEDNGPGISTQKGKTKEGIGLKITKERLDHLFGTNHQFHLENVVTGGLRVTISIPIRNNDQTVAVS